MEAARASLFGGTTQSSLESGGGSRRHDAAAASYLRDSVPPLRVALADSDADAPDKKHYQQLSCEKAILKTQTK